MEARTLAYESLVGLSVGDAPGGPFQGHPFDMARTAYEPATDLTSMWTDDTQMALSIVEVLTSTGTIDQDAIVLAGDISAFPAWWTIPRKIRQSTPAVPRPTYSMPRGQCSSSWAMTN